jgi:hypothetical protein
MLVTHKTFLPSFGLGFADQIPVCIYTILSINENVGDCAAYRGVAPELRADRGYDVDAMIERIKGGGSKISEKEARELFDEIQEMNLRYRK